MRDRERWMPIERRVETGHGEYTAPRDCPECSFSTVSRDEYWRHWCDKHDQASPSEGA